MFCVYCGTQNPSDAQFCHKCGRGIATPSKAVGPEQSPILSGSPSLYVDPELLPEASFTYFSNGLANKSAKTRERVIREFTNNARRDPRILKSLEYIASDDPQAYVRRAAREVLIAKGESPAALQLQAGLAQENAARRAKARRDIGCGAILLFGGICISLASYANAAPGATYIIFGGAMLWGTIWLLNGLSNRT